MVNNWKNTLDELGVVRIPSVFSKSEMDLLRALSWNSFKDSAQVNTQWKREFPALVFWPKYTKIFHRDPRMVDIVSSVLGKNILQLNSQIYFRLPGDGDQFAWHQDITFRSPKECFNGIETGYLQTAIVIDDMTPDNGAIEFIHRSHREPDLNLIERGTEDGLRKFSRGNRSGTMYCANSGDVVLWSVMIVHGSEPNVSTRSRMYYMNGFAKADCVTGIDFPWYLKDGKLHP